LRRNFGSRLFEKELEVQDLMILPVLPREMERAGAPKVLKNRG
jgi:hypothetical protein